MFLAAVAVIGVLISAWQAWQWVGGKVTRVRTAVRAAEPILECTVDGYGGVGSGFTASIHNSGFRAHDLALTVPTMGVVWQQTFLAGGDWAKPQKSIAGNASLRTTKVGGSAKTLTDPVATLTYEDDFQHVYTLTLPLTQTLRDDGRFNFASLPDKARVDRPTLTALRLWRLRKRV
jgi:hypothetical protein